MPSKNTQRKRKNQQPNRAAQRAEPDEPDEPDEALGHAEETRDIQEDHES